MNFLKKDENKYAYKTVTLVLKDDEYPIERYLFKFICRINNLQCKFFYPNNFSKEEFSEVDNDEAFLLIFSEDYYNMSPKELGERADLYMKENSGKMSLADINTYNFIYLLSNGSLSKYNFQTKKCYNFIENYYACLIKKKN